MWLIRSTHKHISQDALSEYLDGRLQGRPLERVELQLEQCDVCRLELSELQATVAMMQQLPMGQPRRSFVMSAPPLDLPATSRSRPSIFLRAPSWAYAGAASFAVLALVVTVAIGGVFQSVSDSDGQQLAFSQAPQIESASRAAADAAPTSGLAEMGEGPSTSGGDQEAPVSMAAAASAPPSELAALGEPAEDPVVAFSAESTSQDAAAGLAVPELASEPSPETAGADGGAFTKQDESVTRGLMPEKAPEGPTGETTIEDPSISATGGQAESQDDIPAPVSEQPLAEPAAEPMPELFDNEADDGMSSWKWVVAIASVTVILASVSGLYLQRRAARREFP